MSPAQKDELLAYAAELRPPYRESFAAKAIRFEIQAGQGLHHPFIAPHIVTTASDLSVSLAFTYRTKRTDTWTNAHRLNHVLRRLGLDPSPAGSGAVRDHAKSLVVKAARGLKDVAALVRRRGRSPGPGGQA